MDNYTALVVLHNEALATPEAMAYFTDYLKAGQVSAVAINFQYTHTASITENICKKANADMGVNHCFFYETHSVIAW